MKVVPRPAGAVEIVVGEFGRARTPDGAAPKAREKSCGVSRRPAERGAPPAPAIPLDAVRAPILGK